jgi:hypothetical protein
MVREELVAKQVLEYAGAYDSAQAAVSSLNRKSPWGTAARLGPRETRDGEEALAGYVRRGA